MSLSHKYEICTWKRPLQETHTASHLYTAVSNRSFPYVFFVSPAYTYEICIWKRSIQETHPASHPYTPVRNRSFPYVFFVSLAYTYEIYIWRRPIQKTHTASHLYTAVRNKSFSYVFFMSLALHMKEAYIRHTLTLTCIRLSKTGLFHTCSICFFHIHMKEAYMPHTHCLSPVCGCQKLVSFMHILYVSLMYIGKRPIQETHTDSHLYTTVKNRSLSYIF